MDYEESKKLARSPDPDIRRDLAERRDIRPELLYLLAGDADAGVRRVAAENPQTPLQAAARQARDGVISVRSALAVKLARLLPDLDDQKRDDLVKLACEAIRTLAEDEVAAVRRTLATSLRDVACLPRDIADRLARDVEERVAEPILRFSLALSDSDLIALLASRTEPWVAEAVASRARVAPEVADAVIDTRHRTATRILIDNKGAVIAEETAARLDELYPDLGTLLRQRRGLPPKMKEHVRELVEEATFTALAAAPELAGADVGDVMTTAGRRLERVEEAAPGETADEKVRRLVAAGTLDEEAISDAIAMGERAFAQMALAHRARAPLDIVQAILSSGSGKAVTALCWRAGLTMRTALLAQRLLAYLPPGRTLAARDGTDFPLTPEEMTFQLSFSGLDTG